MEVHHHSHSPRKKWTHYFWEFLMLFLAVTLGFFVENQREHYVEHLREKKYAQLLYDDLKTDTMTLARTLNEKKFALAKIDSLRTFIDSNTIAENNELTYYFERFLSRNDVFTSQNVTYTQLMNSGGFRYLRNLDIYKKTADYYNLYDRYHELVETNFGDPHSLGELEASLFNGGDINSLMNTDATDFFTLFSRPGRKFAPVKNDPYHLNRLNIRAGTVVGTLKTSILFLKWLENMARN